MTGPDYTKYHLSVTEELYSVKDRIRNLVTHWGVDGESKEVALRSVMRRHLPQSVIVGRGFVVGPNSSSTQIDVLVVDSNKPTLFKDGDLLIVTPDAVIAAIEVKTKLRSEREFQDAIAKLTKIEDMCRDFTGHDSVWTGLFVFEGEIDHQELILRATGAAYLEVRRAINCISSGRQLFIRHWDRGADIGSTERGPVWHSYDLPNVAPSYFIGNLIDWICTIDDKTAGFAWFPALGGKEAYREWYLPVGQGTPLRF